MLEKLAFANRNRTTYRVGLLQARAYRILKQETAAILKPLGITTIEWAFLGLLYEHKTMRMKDSAQELGVEASFVTAMINRLMEKGLVGESRDETDSRAKCIFLSTKGKEFVPKTETVVRSSTRRLIAGANPRDLLGYIAILEKIIKNAA